MPDPNIPAIYVVVNGPLEMSPGKIAAQVFQLCERLGRAAHAVRNDPSKREFLARIDQWKVCSTTIVRVAKTPAMWERVKAEVDGVVMIDEGWTEVEPDSETCFASWPLLMAEVPKILSNAKVPLLRA